MKKFSLKRILSFTLCLLMLLSFAACGGDSTETGEENQTQQQTEQNTETSVSDVTNDIADVTDGETEPTEDTAEDTADTSEDTQSDESVTDTYTDTETVLKDTETDKPDKVTVEVTTQKPDETTAIPTEKTQNLMITGAANTANDRVLIYGTCEKNSVITSWGDDQIKYDDESDGYNFRIEVSAGQKIHLRATAPGKLPSDEATYDVWHGTNVQMSVFGGRNSMLYYQGTLSHLVGGVHTSESFLSMTKKNVEKGLAEVRKWTGKNTKFVFIICPNPATVYYDEQRDYIASALNGERKETAASQFVDYMQGMDGVIVPDLYEIYDKHKDEKIFYDTDTHWTELGAFYAYRAAMDEIDKSFPKASSYELSDFTVKNVNCSAGDFGPMLGVGNMKETSKFLIPKFSDTGAFYKARRNVLGSYSIGVNITSYPMYSTTSNPKNPVSYVVGDSYGAYFLQFIGMSSSNLFTNQGILWNYGMDYYQCYVHKPDYVFFVFSDRNIDSQLSMINIFWQDL